MRLREPAFRKSPDEGVLVEAEADTPLCLEAAHVVDHAILAERRRISGSRGRLTSDNPRSDKRLWG